MALKFIYFSLLAETLVASAITNILKPKNKPNALVSFIICFLRNRE